MKTELRGKKTAYSTIFLKLVANSLQNSLRSGWRVVRNASLAKGGTTKERPSPHLHKVTTRRNKTSLRTFHTALIYRFEKIDEVRTKFHVK
jgi:hypothetical protein